MSRNVFNLLFGLESSWSPMAHYYNVIAMMSTPAYQSPCTSLITCLEQVSRRRLPGGRTGWILSLSARGMEGQERVKQRTCRLQAQ